MLYAMGVSLVWWSTSSAGQARASVVSSPSRSLPERSKLLSALRNATTPLGPDQNLPPGAIKYPGTKCATVLQPPDYQGCPGPPDNIVNGHPYCQGTARQIGQCLADEQGFFYDPPWNFQPRNWIESCISSRENGGSYDRSGNWSHFGRWQFSTGLWSSYGGQAGDWGYASPAEQDYLFTKVVASSGYGNWTPYDGC